MLLREYTLNRVLLRIFVMISIGINAIGLYFPILNSNDANFYALVSRHIVDNHDWINLTFAGADWLDKPHFPFWVTAVSFKIFGVSAFSYVFPGFIFNLVGAFYTYKIAKYWYDEDVALFSALLYVTSLHLMLSSIDVRAEAYLLGTILPAIYYWLRYDKNPSHKNLILGAVFSACAIMTKGIFVILTIFSGLVTLWIYDKQFKKVLTTKWLIVPILILTCIVPELIALYLQFDAHPEKIVFGSTNISGVKFFFIDSQFGRFFNNGPITNTHGNWFFFVHTFLWSFLPWTFVFFVALWNVFKLFKIHEYVVYNKNQRQAKVFLLGSFIPTFIMFSATKFQLDHYINIIIPFAVILTASWLSLKATRYNKHFVFYLQIWLSFAIVCLTIVLGVLLLSGYLVFINSLVGVILLVLFVVLINNSYPTKAVVFPVLAINFVFSFLMVMNGIVYAKYDAGYQIANYLKNQPPNIIIDYKVDLLTLELHSNYGYRRISSADELSKLNLSSCYIVVADSDTDILEHNLSNYKFIRMMHADGLAQNKLVPSLFSKDKMSENTRHYTLYKITK